MRVKLIFAEARAAAVRGVNPEAIRLAAIRLLGLATYADSGATLLTFLKTGEPQGLQVAAVATLAKFNDPSVANDLIEHWPDFAPPVRS
jgi:hypothetical protein